MVMHKPATATAELTLMVDALEGVIGVRVSFFSSLSKKGGVLMGLGFHCGCGVHRRHSIGFDYLLVEAAIARPVRSVMALDSYPA